MTWWWSYALSGHHLFPLFASLYFHIHVFLTDLLVLAYFIATQFLPHLLESWILLDLLPIIRPLNLYFVLSLREHVPPIFGLKGVLDFPNILVGIVEHINSLHRQCLTSLLSCCSSTSANFSLTNFSLTSPFSIISSRSFLALRSGSSSFLFLACSYLGNFSLICWSMALTSACFLAINPLILSRACFSFIFTTSTFSIWDWIPLGFSLWFTYGSGYLLKQNPIISVIAKNIHKNNPKLKEDDNGKKVDAIVNGQMIEKLNYIKLFWLQYRRIMIEASPNSQTLQFKHSSLIRKKINHPIEFPKNTQSAFNSKNGQETQHRNYHMGSTKSTKFSFKSSGIFSLNSHLSPQNTFLPTF